MIRLEPGTNEQRVAVRLRHKCAGLATRLQSGVQLCEIALEERVEHIQVLLDDTGIAACTGFFVPYLRRTRAWGCATSSSNANGFVR